MARRWIDILNCPTRWAQSLSRKSHSSAFWVGLVLCLGITFSLVRPCNADQGEPTSATHFDNAHTGSQADGQPSTSHLLIRALTLRDHRTRVVVIGTTLLGIAAGVIGTFAYLRKRAMMGDALSHATLPGVAGAFMIMGTKNLPVLLTGAAATGVLGVLCVAGLRRIPRIKEDAAIGIVLSVFFGIGMVLMSLVQEMNTGQEAGLNTFIYGKAAALLVQDAQIIGGVTLLVLLGAVLLFKEFRAVCFDSSFAASQGISPTWVDFLMMGLVVLTTVVGLQAVGLILVVALLIIPSAAARFWTDHLVVMTLLAGLIGAVSGWIGSTISASAPRLPTGAIIVIVAGCLFFGSMLFAPHRGVIASLARRWSIARKVALQHLLRALAECEELADRGKTIPLEMVLPKRSWSAAQLRRLIQRATRLALLERSSSSSLQLTTAGRIDAERILRNHRLWEMYLIKYADIAPSHVDRDADEIEHILPVPLVQELERALLDSEATPPSPHGEEGAAR